MRKFNKLKDKILRKARQKAAKNFKDDLKIDNQEGNGLKKEYQIDSSSRPKADINDQEDSNIESSEISSTAKRLIENWEDQDDGSATANVELPNVPTINAEDVPPNFRVDDNDGQVDPSQYELDQMTAPEFHGPYFT